MTSAKYELPPIPRRERPIPVSEVPKEVSGLEGHWLIRRSRRGDGPPCFRAEGSKRPMTFRSWVTAWSMGLTPSGPPTETPSSLKRPQPQQRRKRVRELEPA
jgi:hypothetical protein